MGEDKALIKIDGISMIQRVAQALAEAGREPIRIAVSAPEKIDIYAEEIDSSLDIEWVLDGQQFAGPVDAILEALSDPICNSLDTLQLASVDVPWIISDVFWELENSLSNDDFLAMPTDERVHPLLALIRPTKVKNSLKNWDGTPLHIAFSNLPHTLLMTKGEYLRNVNRMDDLD